MNLPKITIVTPSFNQGHFIEETINSILSQNYPNLEYIIIDGKSTDNTVEIIKKYGNYITFWESTKDKGQSEAINKGMRKSTGDILTWICSDDLLLENSLQTAANYFLENPTISLIHGKTKTFGEGYEDEITAGFYSDLSIDCFTHMAFPQASSFFKRNIFENQSYEFDNQNSKQKNLVDESLHYCMDYDLLLRIVLNYDILQVDELFSAYRLHPASKTVSEWSKFEVEKDKVFLRLLNTLKTEKEEVKEVIQFLKELGIESNENLESTKIYNFDKQKVENLNLDKIIQMFLYRKIPVLFDAKEYETVVLYCEALQKTYPNFYKLINLDSMYQTSKYNSLSSLGKLGWKFKKLI